MRRKVRLGWGDQVGGFRHPDFRNIFLCSGTSKTVCYHHVSDCKVPYHRYRDRSSSRFRMYATGSGAADTTCSPGPECDRAVPPIPVASQNGINLAYELELVPADGKAPVVDKVEVLDPATGKILYTADDGLLAALYHPATVPPPTATELQDGTGKLRLPRVSLWFVVSPGAVPDRLSHRLTLNRTAAGMPRS